MLSNTDIRQPTFLGTFLIRYSLDDKLVDRNIPDMERIQYKLVNKFNLGFDNGFSMRKVYKQAKNILTLHVQTMLKEHDIDIPVTLDWINDSFPRAIESYPFPDRVNVFADAQGKQDVLLKNEELCSKIVKLSETPIILPCKELTNTDEKVVRYDFVPSNNVKPYYRTEISDFYRYIDLLIGKQEIQGNINTMFNLAVAMGKETEQYDNIDPNVYQKIKHIYRSFLYIRNTSFLRNTNSDQYYKLSDAIFSCIDRNAENGKLLELEILTEIYLRTMCSSSV